uniref:Uncharacterized protein n=1 Tax=Arundo donax TaxID=35708 RepID=A0A0A9C4C2_ARUDO
MLGYLELQSSYSSSLGVVWSMKVGPLEWKMLLAQLKLSFPPHVRLPLADLEQWRSFLFSSLFLRFIILIRLSSLFFHKWPVR